MQQEIDRDGMIDKRDMDHRMCHAPVTYKGRVFNVVHQICNGWTFNVNVHSLAAEILSALSALRQCGSILTYGEISTGDDILRIRKPCVVIVTSVMVKDATDSLIAW